MDQAELKESTPHLVVGDAPESDLMGKDSVEITAEQDKLELVPLSAPEDVSTKEAPTKPSAETVPFVLSVVDIMALCFVVLSFVVVTLNIGGDTSEGMRFFAALEGFVFLVFNLFFHSYYFSDVVSRIHQAREDEGFWPRFDRVACIHPIIVGLFIGVPIAILVAAGSGAGFMNVAWLIPIFTICLLVPPALRWFYLVGSLFYKCSHLNKGPANGLKNWALITAVVATAGSLYTLTTLWALPSPLASSLNSLVIAICFIALRNIIIRGNTKLQLALAQEPQLEPAVPPMGEVQIRYNHFVEIQKWFKQRMALRSPWKIGLLLLILLAAVACNLHVEILNFIVTNINARGGAAAAGAAGGAAGTNLNALANSALVMAFGWITFAIGAGSLTAYVRAPKKIAAGKDGLRLKFARVSGKKDLVVNWRSITHIKVERPPGKTSAASDRLVFERRSGIPLTLKLAGISSADDREKLLGAIDRFAPQISREAAIEETLRRPADQNYTELWLQALAAPPKREKLKPLVKDAVLSDNRYLVRRELGVGGQGFAYLALDQRKDKEVVLKEFVLPVFVDINARRQSLESFEKEAKLMTRLDHPQVVKLEGFFVEDHRAYLVLEHIDGQNLRQILERDGPMPEERIKELAGQMCNILSYLHSLSPPLVHRDFTPDNLILHKDGTLKLIDFNVAQQVEYATTGTVVGKQAYLPPEQFRGQAVPASDLYAMGATLYFLAGGKDPTPISVARSIEDGLKVSPELDHLISSLTQMEPQARPTTAQAVADLLRPASLSKTTETAEI